MCKNSIILQPWLSLFVNLNEGNIISAKLARDKFCYLGLLQTINIKQRRITFQDGVLNVSSYTHLCASQWILSKQLCIPVGILAKRSALLHCKSMAQIWSSWCEAFRELSLAALFEGGQLVHTACNLQILYTVLCTLTGLWFVCTSWVSNWLRLKWGGLSGWWRKFLTDSLFAVPLLSF